LVDFVGLLPNWQTWQGKWAQQKLQNSRAKFAGVVCGLGMCLSYKCFAIACSSKMLYA
jgi:hypothetical protein